jgi:predicted O-methyltransferase YrrM
VGTFVGYAAIRMGRRQAEGALTVTIEKEWRWWLAARRFVWQVGSVCQSVSVVLCFSLSVVTRTRAHAHTYFSGWHPSGQAMATISMGS